jgi:hypothetical protein
MGRVGSGIGGEMGDRRIGANGEWACPTIGSQIDDAPRPRSSHEPLCSHTQPHVPILRSIPPTVTIPESSERQPESGERLPVAPHGTPTTNDLRPHASCGAAGQGVSQKNRVI